MLDIMPSTRYTRLYARPKYSNDKDLYHKHHSVSQYLIDRPQLTLLPGFLETNTQYIGFRDSLQHQINRNILIHGTNERFETIRFSGQLRYKVFHFLLYTSRN
jgi:hypothetical protein